MLEKNTDKNVFTKHSFSNQEFLTLIGAISTDLLSLWVELIIAM